MRNTCLALAIGLMPMTLPAAEPDDQALIEELRALADKARERRAADRWLQRELDDLVARHDWPWQRELVSDDFSDGDYQHGPRWDVLSGRFWVSRERGLRSRIEPDTRPGAEQPTSVEAAVLGLILQKALGDGDQAAAPASTGDAVNRIRLTTRITNAFALETAFSLEAPNSGGAWSLAVLQGDTGRYGYRLHLSGGRDGHAELERVSNGRSAVVERVRLRLDLADGARHRLSWRQDSNDEVVVELDDARLFTVRDRAFRDDYQQLVLSHRAGDLTVHNIRVSGTR